MSFSLSRSEGFPTQYAPNPTPVTVDVLEAGLITAFLIIAVSFLISFPTARFKTVCNVTIFIYFFTNFLYLESISITENFDFINNWFISFT